MKDEDAEGFYRLYTIPRYIFKDMLKDEENAVDAKNFSYSVQIPGYDYISTTQEMLTDAAKVTMDMLKVYTKGNRELVLINKPQKPKDDEENTEPQES